MGAAETSCRNRLFDLLQRESRRLTGGRGMTWDQRRWGVMCRRDWVRVADARIYWLGYVQPISEDGAAKGGKIWLCN